VFCREGCRLLDSQATAPRVANALLAIRLRSSDTGQTELYRAMGLSRLQRGNGKPRVHKLREEGAN
jgi:hypothetical protein